MFFRNNIQTNLLYTYISLVSYYNNLCNIVWTILLTYLRDKDECHAQKAAENDCEWDERERRILLAGDNERHGRGDEAEHHHVVDTHSHVSGVVDRPHFDRSCLVGEE